MRLEVNVHPQVSLDPGPRYTTEGNEVWFPTCRVTGRPKPLVTWRKSSGQLPTGRVSYYNNVLQRILQVRKEDSDTYICSTSNLLGSVEAKTVLHVVPALRFIVKPPATIKKKRRETLILNCSATGGGSEPVVRWRKQRGYGYTYLPIGRTQQINGKLVIRDLRSSDEGYYRCFATSGGIFEIRTDTVNVQVESGPVVELNSSDILSNFNDRFREQLNLFLKPVLPIATRRRFVRCWHANSDGWGVSSFHSNCDDMGPTLSVIKVGKYIFGGYTDASWSGISISSKCPIVPEYVECPDERVDYCGSASLCPSGYKCCFSGCEFDCFARVNGIPCNYGPSNKSFIYSLYNINGYNPVKLQIKPRYHDFAIYGCPSYGLTFGNGHDIYISHNAASNRNSYTNCNHTYPLPPGYSSAGSSCTFYAGSKKFTPTDIEVFYETTTRSKPL